ncbi:CaiB/BaiF CoA transferase family protein [Mycobacterium intracellulare]|uniref:CoA transferase n=1 Tax=Mycobacterium intracellulare subsp. chimaera TaxID=222805 RepID=A0A7U5MPZ5_MYCIT|nr:CoA transferase [Mycobacterium intracellulare]ASL17534.1 L-carnitine dehydratase/bile acid-inducible protein F [Mycobacterium intracellulare subsp. chimaera]MDM3929470.1 CoA transferase [Mycobacterium intracellulare subsp. chimaera]
MSGPLSGIRVVDCSTGTAGPRATGILADYGADVVWVEPPGGDRFRATLAVHYSVFNRGKRSVTLDLKTQEGQSSLRELIAQSDVFFESWRPGVADRLGLGFADLHAAWPSLVCVSVSGFGCDSPYRNLAGYEAIVHALVGSMGEQPGHRDGPIFQGLPFASIGAAHLAAIGTVAALYRRHADGIGRHIETSLLDGALVYLSMLWGDADVPPPPRDPGANRLVARNFRCSDDEIIGVHTGAVGAFGRFLKIVGLQDRIPASDDGLDMGIPLTPEQRTVLSEDLPRIFETRTRGEWLEVLRGADICAIPLLEPIDVFDEQQTLHNGMVIRVDDPVIGAVDQVAPAARFADSPAAVAKPAPIPGQDDASQIWSTTSGKVEISPYADRRPFLEGLRVLELGAFYAGPYGSRLLADLGADVIRLETLVGDPNRGLEVIFRGSHAGMRSIAIDLKRPEAEPLIERLLMWADVVHNSMRPGVADRIGVGYERARSLNPEIVYAYAPGWGSTGPLAGGQSFAPLISGYVGATSEVSGQFNPPVYPIGNEDPANGLLGALSMLMAAFHQRRTGNGQYVEHPQLNAALCHVAHIVRRPDGEVLGAMRLDPSQSGFGPLERLYETSDGWICVVATTSIEIGGLADVLGVEILGDPRFGNVEQRQENQYALEAVLSDAIGMWKTQELVDALQVAGVAAVEPVPHNSTAFLRDPENLRTGRSVECPHSTRGKVREVGLLIRATDVAYVPHRVAPQLGEHNDEVLTALGFSASDIAELRRERVIL